MLGYHQGGASDHPAGRCGAAAPLVAAFASGETMLMNMLFDVMRAAGRIPRLGEAAARATAVRRRAGRAQQSWQ